MDSEVTHDYHPFFRVYKDGHIERFIGTPFVPASDDSTVAVRSKDVVISNEPKVSARIFLPKTVTPNQKLPLLVYVHGGAFSIESAFSSLYYHYLTSLVADSNVVVVSVEYRLAPEHPIPACYDDTWTVMEWTARHSNGQGPDLWLNEHADFNRVFVAGDSAGANISHNVMVKYSNEGLGSVKILGIVLVHPYFGNKKPAKLWEYICPDSTGLDDPRLNPAAHPGLLAKLGKIRVLICTAEKDHLRDRGWDYYEGLKKSGWGGEVEIVETEGEDHVFHLFNPKCEKAGVLMKLVTYFLNENKVDGSIVIMKKPVGSSLN
ncbi:hypothetical protein LguiB_007104 [Lonicera macranthoides]